MDNEEKLFKLEALDLALQDLDNIIDNMKKNDYNKEQINEYIKKRWEVWNEIHQVKKA